MLKPYCCALVPSSVPPLVQTAAVSCSASYNITQADTCFSVATAAKLQLSGFLALNPGLRVRA